ncbi:GNAT family N-acetyltransferase [Paenibacillus sp. MBLB4367]|uniref:GNAT family N-acetyltransferase n=1 Tax=Paenibacillus sp. MBLB4367 TaxID=3384767 RepID=UPI003908177B
MRMETERLIIRDYREDDWASVHRYASSPLVAVHMLWGPNTEQETRSFLQQTVAWQQESPRTEFELAVTLRDSGLLIGGCGLHAEDGKGEIGYCFHPDYWRQGYGSESAQAMLSLGFEQLKLHRIYATCRPGNTGSAKVMEHVGMRYEGLLREHIRAKGRWHDSLLYAILDREFAERQGATGNG